MITATDIHKSYSDLEVLKGVSLHVQKGEVVALVGASGAGKSTLLHILGTLDNADSGTTTIAGQKINSLSARKLAAFRNQHVGFVFQFHHLLPEFDALENVEIPGFLAKMNTNDVKQKAMELLSLFGLSKRLDHRPGQLSGGEQQRVAVARALINNPDVVLADEPSGNLDSKNARELHKLFFDLRDKLGQTFVIATHNEELAAMSDRIVRMKDGKLVE